MMSASTGSDGLSAAANGGDGGSGAATIGSISSLATAIAERQQIGKGPTNTFTSHQTLAKIIRL